MQKSQPHIVWINGAFGTGKTTAAKLLAQEYPGAAIVDPEEVGSLLRPVLQPVVPVRDFQEWPAWRTLVASMLNAVLQELPEEAPTVIVPQTVTVEDYWSEITSALDSSVNLTPVVLNIDQAQHRRRTDGDFDEPDARQWRLTKFSVFKKAEWLRHSFIGIDVSKLSPAETAAAIRAVSF
ncbi:AAA family ATPase [Corynebacterium casei]|uniref:AAA family ATPase n=1 Tax=Corynebacterium casei TaxID=160386 RepID=UPI003F9DB1DA